MITELGPDAQAIHEEATDELARLDECCSLAPQSIPRALWLRAVAELSRSSPDALDVSPLIAAEGDVFHEASLAPAALAWRTLLAAEERRARGGAFLSASRFEEIAPALASYPERDRLEAIWRESGRGRPVLVRALDSTAWFPHAGARGDSSEAGGEQGERPSGNPGEAIAALLLCAGGRTDRVRLLPFAGVVGEERFEAISVWRDGDAGPWARAALGSVAHRARVTREAVRNVMDATGTEEETVAAMGRAGLTARRALGTLRSLLATSMPALAEELGISRPAAAAALERLTGAGLLREVTARARDRVYAYEAAVALAESRLAS
jgi:hypothetical protein